MLFVADIRGQRAGVGKPVPAAAAVLGGAGARVPGAPAAPAAAAPVSLTSYNSIYKQINNLKIPTCRRA